MARYNIRDLIGHFVKPRSAQGKMCPHACCRNRRVHPANMPVILPSRLLGRASDDEPLGHRLHVGSCLVGCRPHGSGIMPDRGVLLVSMSAIPKLRRRGGPMRDTEPWPATTSGI